jgi:hypothetical protein
LKGRLEVVGDETRIGYGQVHEIFLAERATASGTVGTLLKVINGTFWNATRCEIEKTNPTTTASARFNRTFAKDTKAAAEKDRC